MRRLNQLPVLFAVILIMSTVAGCRKSSPVDRLIEVFAEVRSDSVVDYGKYYSRFSEDDMKYKLTDNDRRVLVDSLGRMISEDYKEYALEMLGTDTIPAGMMSASLADDLDLLKWQIGDCRTFGEFMLVVSDMKGVDTWRHRADFLPSYSEREVVDQYIMFCKDEEEAVGDHAGWPLAKCHRSFHRAAFDNIAISDASRKKIVDAVSQSAVKQLNQIKAEMGNSMEFASEAELRQQIEDVYKPCKKFRDLPNLWFLE